MNLDENINLAEQLNNSNVQAFLRALRYGEGTDSENGYRILFGGKTFDSFSDHPRVIVEAKLGSKTIRSSAAGAYQILQKTWDGLVKQYGQEVFPDFSPASQDRAAVALIIGRGAIGDITAGDIKRAVSRCCREWASLPGAPYGQPTIKLETFLKLYKQYGGNLSEDKEEIPVPVPIVVAKPIFSAILAGLTEALPWLKKLFAKGEPERLVNKVIDIATGAAGAVNAQDMLERVLNDDSAKQSVSRAIEERWFELQEAGGGGIGAARAAAAEYAKGPRNWPLEIVTYLFTVLFGIGVVTVLYKAEFSQEHVTMILQAVIGLSLMVGGFWLGASYTTSRRGLNAAPQEEK